VNRGKTDITFLLSTGVVRFSYGAHGRSKESLRYYTVSLRIDDGLFTIMLRRRRNNHGQVTMSIRFVDGATDMWCHHGASLVSTNINDFHWHHIDLCLFLFLLFGKCQKNFLRYTLYKRNSCFRLQLKSNYSCRITEGDEERGLSGLDVGYINVDSSTVSVSILCLN